MRHTIVVQGEDRAFRVALASAVTAMLIRHGAVVTLEDPQFATTQPDQYLQWQSAIENKTGFAAGGITVQVHDPRAACESMDVIAKRALLEEFIDRFNSKARHDRWQPHGGPRGITRELFPELFDNLVIPHEV